MVLAGVHGDGRETVLVELGHLEAAKAERHKADEIVRHPAHDACIVHDLLVDEGGSTGHAIPLRHAERHMHAAAAIVAMGGNPEQGVFQQELLAHPQSLEELTLIGQLEDEPLTSRNRPRKRDRHERFIAILREQLIVRLLHPMHRLAGQRGWVGWIRDPRRRSRSARPVAAGRSRAGR